MTDWHVRSERHDTLIDHGVASLVEQDTPHDHAQQVRRRVAAAEDAVGSRAALAAWWHRPRLVTALVLVVAAVGAGLWVLRDGKSPHALQTRLATNATRRPPSVAPLSTSLHPLLRGDVRAMPVEPPQGPGLVGEPAGEPNLARAALEIESSRARFLAFLDALHQLPPEVLLRDRPTANEPLPEPTPLVVPEIVITPLDARASPDEEISPGDFSPRGDE